MKIKVWYILGIMRVVFIGTVLEVGSVVQIAWGGRGTPRTSARFLSIYLTVKVFVHFVMCIMLSNMLV